MKKKLSTIILVLMFLTGLSLLLYPTVSDYWNSFHQTRVINNYTQTVSQLDNNSYESILQDAYEYNQKLLEKTDRFIHSKNDTIQYMKQLNVMGDGVMGYIEIPKIKVYLPIYHGDDEAMLQVAIGHVEGSSLPVGGESTHCVFMGHRGLPSARLFTDLDQLIEGDTFKVHILDEFITYQVDQILIVEPTEIDALQIVEGEDYVTLVTCTPYGVNSHRLLIRGHRVENETEGIRVSADALQIEPILIAPILAIPMILLLVIFVFIFEGRKKS